MGSLEEDAAALMGFLRSDRNAPCVLGSTTAGLAEGSASGTHERGGYGSGASGRHSHNGQTSGSGPGSPSAACDIRVIPAKSAPFTGLLSRDVLPSRTPTAFAPGFGSPGSLVPTVARQQQQQQQQQQQPGVFVQARKYQRSSSMDGVARGGWGVCSSTPSMPSRCGPGGGGLGPPTGHGHRDFPIATGMQPCKVFADAGVARDQHSRKGCMCFAMLA